MSDGGWWVFRRPLLRDWLFVAGLVVGLILLGFAIPSLGDMGWFAAVVTVLAMVPFAILLVGIAGGSVRRYRHGRGAGA